MTRGRWVLAGLGCLLVGFLLGRISAPPSVAIQRSDRVLDASEMRAAVAQVLGEPRAFPRASALIRLFEALDSENVSGAVEAVAARSGRWDPVDLQLFLTAWVHLDPVSALEEVLAWPIRSRREIGLSIAMREWAASGDAIAAADFFQTITDSDTRSMMAGPLVRGWALSGDIDGAFELARRLWQSDQQFDVVDGLVRGIVHVEGPKQAFGLAKELEPGTHGEFEQRFARVALNLGGREDAPGAAAAYSALAGAETPDWLAGTLARIAALWRNDDPQSALDWLVAQAPSAERDQVLRESVASWARQDFDATWAWLEGRIGPLAAARSLSETESMLLSGVIRRLARTRPVDAAPWAEQLRNRADREAMMMRVAHFWAMADAAAAQAWIDGLDLSPGLRTSLLQAAARGRRKAEAEDGEPDFAAPAGDEVDRSF